MISKQIIFFIKPHLSSGYILNNNNKKKSLIKQIFILCLSNYAPIVIAFKHLNWLCVRQIQYELD